MLLFLFFALFDAQSLNSFIYTNIGGMGYYNETTNIQPNSGVWNVCPSNYCSRKSVCVSGTLAPFDQDWSPIFSGPQKVLNVAVYQPATSGSTWTQIASWTPTSSNNLKWMENGGDWSVCAGSAQSYAVMNGTLADGRIVNIMSATNCSGSNCHGFARGVPALGYAGDSKGQKMFAFKVQMPHNCVQTSNCDMPSIWFLNGQILRTNQWGCNCRGMGGNGGCGELDIAESLSTGANLTSEIYSFKGATGIGNNYFVRPVNAPVTFLTVFNATGTGTISIVQLNEATGSTQFPYSSTSISFSTVNAWIQSATPSRSVALGTAWNGATCPAGTAPDSTNSETPRFQLQMLSVVSLVCLWALRFAL